MDDLLDLSWSDSKGQNGGGESGSTSSKTGSSFDLLSRPTPNANYFSSSGKSTPLQPALGTVSASPLNPASSVPTRNGSSAVTPARTQSPAAGDAFSSLLGVSSGGGKQNLTMAEKQAELAAQRAADAEADKARWGNGDFWNKLEGGGVSGSIVAPTPQNAKSQQLPKALQPELRDTSRPASAAPSPAPVQKDGKAGTFWDSHNLLAPASKSESRASTPASRPTSAKPAGEFGWDDDDDLLGGPAVKPAAKQKAQPNAQPQSWDDDLLGSGSKPSSKSTADPWDLDALSSAVPESRDAYGGDSDDDLLGELGRPAESVSAVVAILTQVTEKQPPRSPTTRSQWSISPAAYHRSDRGDGVPARSGEEGSGSYSERRGCAGCAGDTAGVTGQHACPSTAAA